MYDVLILSGRLFSSDEKKLNIVKNVMPCLRNEEGISVRQVYQ